MTRVSLDRRNREKERKKERKKDQQVRNKQTNTKREKLACACIKRERQAREEKKEARV